MGSSQQARMSYYRYITGLYKSYWPELNRTLRSSSVPRCVPDIDTSRYRRGTSLPPSSYHPTITNATPFNDRYIRARSVPPSLHASVRSRGDSHYTDFDYKVMDYQGRLANEYNVRNFVSQSRSETAYRNIEEARRSVRSHSPDSFSYKYNYYDANKHSNDYLYESSRDVLGNWKHYNLSKETLNYRNQRAQSPLHTRELNRYFETKKRSNYIGDLSSGGSTDFRHYNYRRVPYFGASDAYQYVMRENKDLNMS